MTRERRQAYNREDHAKHRAARNAASKAWHEKNKERVNRLGRERRAAGDLRWRNQNLKSKFGITIEQYNVMLSAQGGLCAICGREETSRVRANGRVRPLAVDHDHDENRARALLCQACNIGIGYFSDDTDRMAKAIDYLNKHKRPPLKLVGTN